MTAGSSSIPEVRRLLAVLAAGKRAAEIGTAYGLGAEALASTARSVVTVERDPERDGQTPEPAAGVHFVVFNPSSDDFHRNRLAMDGVLPDGTKLRFPPGSRGQGFNSVLKTTHRQNFLVPPRAHRSFPLAELRA